MCSVFVGGFEVVCFVLTLAFLATDVRCIFLRLQNEGRTYTLNIVMLGLRWELSSGTSDTES